MKTSSTFLRAMDVTLAHGKNLVTPSPIQFAFPSGKAVALIGPNGSGKTTLLRAFIGEPSLHSGEILIGRNALSFGSLGFRELSRLVAIVPQEHQYPKHLLLKDCLRLAFLPEAGLFGKLPEANTPIIRDALEQFGLAALAERALGELSTGERQRAFLARAFLQNPRVLLLDEPTNHLDPGGREQFWNALSDSRKKKDFDVVISTHDLSFVESHCDWVCALKKGGIFFCGSVGDFFKGERMKDLFGPDEIASSFHSSQ